MSTRGFSLLAFLLTLLAVGGYLVGTVSELPARVPTHFGPSGAPDGWMSRQGYFAYMLAFSVGFPVLLAALVAFAPRIAPRWTNVPNRDYWLAPARRAELFGLLASHACWLGAATSLTAGATHALLLRAARLDPPRLEAGPFLAMLGVALAAYALWGVVLYRRLRLPRERRR